MSHEQSTAHESDVDASSRPADAEPGKSRLPQALREQFHRAFTPGVLALITVFDETAIENPIGPL